MSKFFTSADVFANSLEFIDSAVANWIKNAKEPIYKFPAADITIVLKDSDIYLMSKRETFRKKVAFMPLDIDQAMAEPNHDGNSVLLQTGDAEVDFINAILAATTR